MIEQRAVLTHCGRIFSEVAFELVSATACDFMKVFGGEAFNFQLFKVSKKVHQITRQFHAFLVGSFQSNTHQFISILISKLFLASKISLYSVTD